VQYEQIETEMFMLENFIRARVEMLNQKVIDALGIDGLAVKMFQPQINGGLKECCEFTFEGIPFQQVNKSRQIIVGMQLIEVLSKHYGVSLPLFVDNSESCNFLPEVPYQVISLRVTEDETLTVKTGE
jgi:hypothetical protein